MPKLLDADTAVTKTKTPVRPVLKNPGKTVVMQTRVSQRTAALIRMAALAKGLSEAEILRRWIEVEANKINPADMDDLLRSQIESEARQRRQAFDDLAAVLGDVPEDQDLVDGDVS